MAEPKRIQLTTVASKPEVKSVKKPSVTVRFNLSIADSTDKTCPEFFYKDLVKKKGSSEKDGKANLSTDDPFGEEDDAEHDKMVELAKRFEDKYGPKLGAKKRKKLGRLKDLVDLGDGYDIEDPFIDNSEAYDEIVPQSLTTRHGGFYINAGKLDFREIKDDSDDDFVVAKKKGKKRTITSDSESDEEEKMKKKRKLKDGLIGEKKKKKLLNADGEKIFKKPKKPLDKDKFVKKKKTSPTVSELLKQQSQSTSAPVSHANGSILDMDVQSQSSNEETSQDAHDRIDSIIDSVIAMNSGDHKNLDSIILDLDKEDSNGKDDGSKSQDPTTIPELPGNMPKELEATIQYLKEIAKNSRDGKCKFFTNEVNDKLLVVEVESKKLGSCGLRSKIYNHLAAFLPCSKDTLLKRAKKLHQSRQDDEIKEPIQKLRDAINGMMPALQEKYEAECQKQAQLRQEENTKEDAPKDNDTEDSDEDKSQSTTDSNKKGLKGVRKKFEWTDSIRSLLCEIVRIKMKSYEVTKKANQTAEEYVKQFLETDIRPLWPKGWMQTRTLFKESRAAHSMWTVPQKPKSKPVNVLMSKSATSASNSNSSTPQTFNNNNIPKFTPGSTPVRPTSTYEEITREMAKKVELSASNKAAPARSAPTLLDYASRDNSGDSQKSSPSPASVSSASAGLSLLASSAANQKYMDRSWDHVVSDIIKTSLSPKKSEQPSPSNPLKSPESSFLEQFQKYAMLQQGVKDKGPSIDLTQAKKMASLLMQAKPLSQQQQMQQKLKAALQGQSSASSSSVSKPVTKNVSKLDSGITVQTMQSKPTASAADGKPKPGISLSSEDVYRRFLQESGKLPQNISHLPSSQTSAQKSNSNQARTPGISAGQSLLSNTQNPSPSGLKMSGVQKTPYSGLDYTSSSGNVQSPSQMKVQRTSPSGMGQMSRPGQSPQGHSLLRNNNSSPGMQQMYGKQPSPSSMHSYTKQPSPSNLNKSLSPTGMQGKSISPSGVYSNKSVSPTQGKAQNSVWSVASMTQGTSQKSSTSPFSQPHIPQVHKPIPGYQGLKLNTRDTSPSSATPTIPQSPVQAHLPSPDILSPLGISPTSPLFPVTQGSLLHSRLGQTSPITQQADKSRQPPGY